MGYDPTGISIHSLAAKDDFKRLAYTNIDSKDFCLADAGATLLIGGENLRTWNWRNGFGRVLDGDRNPEFLVSTEVAANHTTGQIAAAAERGVYLASDSTGKDGRWTNVPGLWTGFTSDGRYLVVHCPDRVLVYQPKGAELGDAIAVFRELNAGKDKITSEVDVYDEDLEQSRKDVVTRGAIEFGSSSSLCVVDDVIYTSFYTQFWDQKSPGNLSNGAVIETWCSSLSGQSQVLTHDKENLPDRCMVQRRTSNLAIGVSNAVCEIKSDSQASPYLVELSTFFLRLTPVRVSNKTWQFGDTRVIRIVPIPGIDDDGTGGAACFAISKQKNSVIVGYYNGYLAEWKL